MLPGDVRDESLLKNLFETHKPAWVLHAAAHKHVALMEDNPQEGSEAKPRGSEAEPRKTKGELDGEAA